MFFVFSLDFVFFDCCVFVCYSWNTTLSDLSKQFSRLVVAYLIVALSFVYCFSCVSVVFTLDCIPVLGLHMGGVVGSLQPSIHMHLSPASNIVANSYQGWLLHFLMLDYHLFIVFHDFLLFFTRDHNPTLGPHMDLLMNKNPAPWSTHTKSRLCYQSNLLERLLKITKSRLCYQSNLLERLLKINVKQNGTAQLTIAHTHFH